MRGIVSSNKGVKNITNKSRADYFRERRKERGQFYVEIEKEKLNKLTEKLDQQNKTKTSWLNQKIDEELSQ
jgi:hypothetical protein